MDDAKRLVTLGPKPPGEKTHLFPTAGDTLGMAIQKRIWLSTEAHIGRWTTYGLSVTKNMPCNDSAEGKVTHQGENLRKNGKTQKQHLSQEVPSALL